MDGISPLRRECRVSLILARFPWRFFTQESFFFFNIRIDISDLFSPIPNLVEEEDEDEISRVSVALWSRTEEKTEKNSHLNIHASTSKGVSE